MKFRLCNCDIIISFPFISFITSLSIFDKSGTMIWGILAAFIHEIGHIIAMVLINRKPVQIKLGLFDINIITNKQSYKNMFQEMFIILAGPLANIIFTIISYLLLKQSNKETFNFLTYENLFLALLNLLPIESLDGGQIVYILLLNKFNFITCQNIIRITSFFVLTPLAALGFLLLLKSKYNFSLLSISFYLIAIILFKKDDFF